MKLTAKLLLTALLTTFSSAAAFADSVSLSLSNPNAFVPITGGTYTFYGTISAAATNTGLEYLNADTFNFSSPLSLDDSAFYLNTPLYLAAGTSYTGALFTVTASNGAAFGNYLGSYSVLGGSTSGSLNTLGTVNFSVATTPEPESFVLLLTGLGGLLAVRRRFAAAG